ncbi:hypothetical protein [uncultured Paraglaciecola sp.]|uniref:hypothetical protein n=1 Tax=uncultured Paraglaciecola sp. TaxID=1765024 RepID=UPI00263485A3|nr:hypothetical protein [uncultured Paraglaciecola sp.]
MGRLSRLIEKVDAVSESLKASRSVGYNVPDIPQRNISSDYLSDQPAASDEYGDLLQTIDGERLIAPHVAGRRKTGGGDEAIDQKELEFLAQDAGATISYVPRRSIGNDAGRVKNAHGKNPEILIDKDLTGGKKYNVESHEVSHIIDEKAGQLSTKGIKKDLEKIYNELNNPFYRDGQARKQYALPQYDMDRELSAEAIRAYLQNPNWIKTKYPAAAKRIRETVNSNPDINKHIQFNTLVPAALGVGMMGQSEDAEAMAEPAKAPEDKGYWRGVGERIKDTAATANIAANLAGTYAEDAIAGITGIGGSILHDTDEGARQVQAVRDFVPDVPLHPRAQAILMGLMGRAQDLPEPIRRVGSAYIDLPETVGDYVAENVSPAAGAITRAGFEVLP